MATFKERYEQWKKNKTQQESGATSGGTASFQERFNAWRRENRGQELAQDASQRLTKWTDSYNVLAKAYNDRYARRSAEPGTQAYVGDSKEWYDGFSAQKEDLQRQTGELLTILERDRGVFGDEWTDSVKQSLQSGQAAYTQMGSLAAKDRDFWANFTPTQEQAQAGLTGQDLYDQWNEQNFRSGSENAAGRQQRYAENQKIIDELTDFYDNGRTIDLWYQDYQERPWDTTEEEAIEKLAQYEKHQGLMKKYGSLDAAKAEIERLEADNLQYERGEGGYVSKTVDDYREVSQREDFAQVSAVRDYANASRKDLERYDASVSEGSAALSAGGSIDEEGNIRDADGNIVQSAKAPAIGDKLGMFLSAGADGVTEAYNLLAANNGNYTNTWANLMQEGDQGSWDYLTEQEIGIYYYLLNKSQEDAYQYLADMRTELNRRQTLDESGQWNEAYDQANWLGKVGMNAATVPAQLVGGIAGSIDNAINMLQGKEINPYSAAHSGSHYSQTVRGATAEDLDATGWKIPGVDFTLGDLYQSGMSMADSLAAMGLGGNLGGTLLALGAADNEAYRLYQQGATKERITMGALTAGAAEMIFESLSIGELDKIKNMKSPKTVGQLFKTLLVQGGVEASEEALTEIANTVANAFVMGSQSDWAALMEEKDGNLGAALLDKTLDVLHSGLGGFFSGAGSGGIVGTQGYITNKAETHLRQTADGDTILRTEGGVDALKTLAMEMVDGADGSTQKTLRKLAEQMVDGKQNATRVGKLYGAVQNAITAQNQSDIVKSLETQGIKTARATAIADAVAARQSGERLTPQQQRVLTEIEMDKSIQKTVNEVLDNSRNTEIAKFNLGIASQSLSQNQTAAADPVVVADESAPAAIPATENAAVAEQDGKLVAGETFQKSTGNVVKVRKFTGFTDGKATVELENGESAQAEDISFADSGDEVLFHFVATEENMSTPAANVIWQLWQSVRKNNLPISAKRFTSAAVATYRAGLRGDSTILVNQDARAALTKEQREMIYDTGRRAAQAKADAQQENVDKVYAQAEKVLQQDGAPQKGTYRAVAVRGVQVNKMTRQQRAAFEMASLIAPGVRGNIEMYNGGGELGYYDHKTDTIRLNVNAKWSHTDMLAFTLGHELAHRAKLGSPAKFKAFADFLVEKYGEQGADLEALIGEQLRLAAKHDKTLPENQRRNMTEEQAFEEVVADACQRMLLDTDAGQKLAEFGAKSRDNRSILRDVKRWITEFMDRMRKIFRNVESDSLAAKEFNRFDENTKQILADMFVDMTMDAGEKLSTIKEAGMTEKITTDQGGVRYSYIGDTKDGRRCYQSEFGSKVSLDDRIAEFKKRIATVFNLGAVELKTDVKKIRIRGDRFTSQKNLFGDSKAEDNEYTAKINSLYDLADILATSQYDPTATAKEPSYANQNTKPKNAAHKNVKYWYKFRNEIVFDGVPYTVIFNIRDKGSEQYQYLIDFKENKTPGISNTAVNKPPASAPSVLQGQYTQSGTKSQQNSKAYAKMPNKLPGSRDVADRGKLVDLFEQMVTNSNDYKALENYRKHIHEMIAIEAQVDRLGAEIRKISFAEGPKDMEYLKKLKLLRQQAINRLNNYDNILLRLEKSGVLKAMIDRYRKQITQESFDRAKSYYKERNERRENEIRQYYRESRRQAVERHDMAEIRQRIRKDVQRLDSLLNKGTKEKNVKAELKAFAGAALRTAKGTFLKDYNEYDMIRSGVNTTLSREQKAVFARCRELLEELDRVQGEIDAVPAADNLHDKWDPEAALRREDRLEAIKKELAKNMFVLRDAGIFKTENELMEDSTAGQLMDELLTTYKALKDSESAHVRGVFSEAIYGQMEEVKKFLAGKAIKDMTSIELKELQKMYRMVLHTITTSNELFAQKRKADVRKLGEEVISQLRTEGKEMTPEILDRLAKLGWANLKPETALELIGSDTLTEMMQGLYRGEDTYAQDIEHARKYAEEYAKKCGRKNWDLEKSVSFAGTKITLGQVMSLYAYTKRKQAQGHLEGDGFTHSANVRIKDKKGNIPMELKYVMNATKTYKVTKDMYDDVAKLLTPEQRHYVDAMQEYLSTVMGAKGNEVSMKLYGIELFEETVYFPLKTAAEYRETALAAKAGDVKLKNSGFTKSVQDKASNPIVLDDFEKVWAAHVDKMSLYHGFVLPMEDFDRVYNYHRAEERGITDAEGEVYKTELVDTNETVKVDIENKMGKAANDYIELFMQQLNGGVRGDPTENLFGAALKSFKKSAVMGSLSVAVQQPTAFIRAMAYLDLQDVADWRKWLGKTGKPDGKLVEEMYKYAPVALMKRIGGFDPNLGRSAENYIFGGSGVMEIVDKVAGWLPEHMDEWTWTYIWVCTKRQIHRQHPELRVGSEEFCQKAGERFSQIIRRTQVYDSVLTKSQIMRSKSIYLQMSTAFMNEPTTSLDMYISATIRAKQGKISKKQAARVYGSVVCSQILVAAISAFVYAARDDDEDETYWEKYMSSFVGKSIEGIFMLQSIPFVRDAISIFEGYSAERSDMSLVEDLYQGWQTLKSDKATPWEKVEAFGGSILNFFGIPAKNISRDLRGIFRVVENIFKSSQVKQTNAGMRYAIMKGLPFTDKTTKTVQMENAVKENDAEHILRLLGTYKTEESACNEFRKAVKEVYLRGDVSAEKAMDFLTAYAGNDAGEAQEYLIKWDFKQANPDSVLTDAQMVDYADWAEPAGISLEIYTRYVEEAAACESDKDKDGKTIKNSLKNKILDVIDGLPISRAQKDALYLSNDNFSEKTLKDAQWNR